jgi:hypothetical protein
LTNYVAWLSDSTQKNKLFAWEPLAKVENKFIMVNLEKRNAELTPDQLLEVLFVAANAKTDEEKARVAWRASDFMWRDCTRYGIGFCRYFNNLLQDQNFPWVKDLWTQEEVEALMRRFPLKSEV